MAGNTNAIIDASFILAFLLPDESIQEVEETMARAKEKEINLFSPLLLPFEIFNCLRTSVLRNRITIDLGREIGETFFNLGIALEVVDFSSTLSFATQKNLSFYDASYVWLAKSKKLPLFSLDKRMQKLAAK